MSTIINNFKLDVTASHITKSIHYYFTIKCAYDQCNVYWIHENTYIIVIVLNYEWFFLLFDNIKFTFNEIEDIRSHFIGYDIKKYFINTTNILIYCYSNCYHKLIIYNIVSKDVQIEEHEVYDIDSKYIDIFPIVKLSDECISSFKNTQSINYINNKLVNITYNFIDKLIFAYRVPLNKRSDGMLVSKEVCNIKINLPANIKFYYLKSGIYFYYKTTIYRFEVNIMCLLHMKTNTIEFDEPLLYISENNDIIEIITLINKYFVHVNSINKIYYT